MKMRNAWYLYGVEELRINNLEISVVAHLDYHFSVPPSV